ncbi:hypothetical protein C1645_807253 [Glomus cerebriforme]|uniref:Uncharacterized protein n=1 Tax=Glomus cerebriforme TaxID=658196 RepID=A0A397SU39_9GLOM|nr:hypothetical protein C1645_807253 [Glomus cerebriforme]
MFENSETLSNNDNDSGSYNKTMNDSETDEFMKIIKKLVTSNHQTTEASEATINVLKEYMEDMNSQIKQLKSENNKLKEDNNILLKEKQSVEQNFARVKSDYYESKIKNVEFDDQIKRIQNENNKLKEDNDTLLKEKLSVEQSFSRAKDYYESKIKKLELELQQIKETNSQKTHGQAEEIITSLQILLDDKENNIRDLKQRNTKLKDEALKYQSALGDAINVRLSNDDQNHSVQLKQDILDLQRTLESYVTNLKHKIGINIKEVNILMEQYQCQKEIKPENLDKPFIKGVLQRKVLQQIFEFLKNYRKYKGENFSLESDIVSKSHELLNLIKEFSETRVGTDKVSKVAVIKIRQQIYEILGNRGFSDIISYQDTFIHNFIYYSSKTLNEIMNQYRQINDAERKNEVEKLAPILIRDVLRIFWFRLMVQEPIPEFKYFKSSEKVNPDLMTGRWEDDELDEICVDLCYFPLVGRDLDSDYKIITPAKILTRPI